MNVFRGVPSKGICQNKSRFVGFCWWDSYTGCSYMCFFYIVGMLLLLLLLLRHQSHADSLSDRVTVCATVKATPRESERQWMRSDERVCVCVCESKFSRFTVCYRCCSLLVYVRKRARHQDPTHIQMRHTRKETERCTQTHTHSLWNECESTNKKWNIQRAWK